MEPTLLIPCLKATGFRLKSHKIQYSIQQAFGIFKGAGVLLYAFKNPLLHALKGRFVEPHPVVASLPSHRHFDAAEAMRLRVGQGALCLVDDILVC